MNASDYLKRSTLYRKLAHGPYGDFVDVYAAELSKEGLSRNSTWRSLSLLRDLMDWHVGNGYDRHDLSEVDVESFLDHLSRHWRPYRGDRSALRRLLSALRKENLIPAALPIVRTELEQIIDLFASYLSRERGLVASTVESHKLLAHRFLREVCTSGVDGLGALTPEIVIGYVERHAPDGSADSGKAMCGVVRAFQRYLHLKGFIATALADCVPSIRRWRLAGLPTFLPPEKVQKVLEACDRTTTMGYRDYAVLMILAKLGLRASEVATLNLDDIDWQSGTILVHGKGRRQAIMPLLHDVGAAIVAYRRRRYTSYQGELDSAPENLVDRDVHAARPNEKWLTDITEFQLPAGKVYLSPMIDCFDGLVVSWSVSTRPDAELVNTMLDAAIETITGSPSRPIVHSDRGAHYRWPGWLSRMQKAQLIRSMSRKGCSPDNVSIRGAPP